MGSALLACLKKSNYLAKMLHPVGCRVRSGAESVVGLACHPSAPSLLCVCLGIGWRRRAVLAANLARPVDFVQPPERGNRRSLNTPLAVAIATLTFSAFVQVAAAEPLPVKRLVWTKATAQWTAAAREHGAKADCATWAPHSILECEFRKGSLVWKATLNRAGGTCVYVASYWTARPAPYQGSNFAQSERVGICEPGWWRRLLTPWSPISPG